MSERDWQAVKESDLPFILQNRWANFRCPCGYYLVITEEDYCPKCRRGYRWQLQAQEPSGSEGEEAICMSKPCEGCQSLLVESRVKRQLRYVEGELARIRAWIASHESDRTFDDQLFEYVQEARLLRRLLGINPDGASKTDEVSTDDKLERLSKAAEIALIALSDDPENRPPQWSKEDAVNALREALDGGR